MELPIFPLNTVLFPGATLPLHIFEPRYRLMINRCIEERAPFGVCLIQQGNEVGEAAAQPYATGTTAHITAVQRLEDGRMNIVCTGGNRFTIIEMIEQTPHLIATVEILGRSPEPEDGADDLANTAAGLFAEYVRLNLAVANQWNRTIETPPQPAALADYIASRLAIDLQTKQRLLEERSPKRRLQMELELLPTLIDRLTERVRVARANRWLGFGVLN